MTLVVQLFALEPEVLHLVFLEPGRYLNDYLGVLGGHHVWDLAHEVESRVTLERRWSVFVPRFTVFVKYLARLGFRLRQDKVAQSLIELALRQLALELAVSLAGGSLSSCQSR